MAVGKKPSHSLRAPEGRLPIIGIDTAGDNSSCVGFRRDGVVNSLRVYIRGRWSFTNTLYRVKVSEESQGTGAKSDERLPGAMCGRFEL